MTGNEELWQIEKDFWLQDAAHFRRHLGDDAVMLFPEPVGILRGEAILDALAGVPRWQSVSMEREPVLRQGKTAILCYRATAHRKGEPTYHALCGSTYVSQGGAWRLLAHQQTPVDTPER